MPGILPMKMIRVGSAAQSRIAQACDRCRSKKIRCDGIRPTCTQCSNVGFECKTSDKLSRRAFPRGYTESLEDRVRGLEAEVRELKDLLDEKDEKLDMLSRIHNFSPSRKCSSSLSPSSAAQIKAEVESTGREDFLHIEIPAPVQPLATSMGSSTTLAFATAFEQSVQESGKQSNNISATSLLSEPSPRQKTTTASVAPPRIVSDQYINVFFQEWQPLFPIVHRPSFLRVYEQYLAGPDAGNWTANKQAIAQLFLIFEIAALSSHSRAKHGAPSYENQWRRALFSSLTAPTISMIQSQVLAQLCYLLRGDYTQLVRHRGIAVGMCHELGLHQNHQYHSLTTLEAETRKKVFWCQYVLDKFTSAATGLPMLLRDTDITTEFPADVDDENVTDHGFSPALPGELTKVSGALAFFRISRVLSKALEHLYPAKSSYQLSLNKLHALSDELDQWSEELPDHLRLRFVNDKPATNLIGCRSPLLSLTYFFTRSLIHRPLLCHGSESACATARIVLAAAGKHELQILDLLDERRMNYTFPFNKKELVLTAGLSILWQSLELDEDSKLVRDNVKSLTTAVGMLARENHIIATDFWKVASNITKMEPCRGVLPTHIDINTPAAALINSMPAPAMPRSKSTRKQLQAIASRFPTFSNKTRPEDMRRATVPQANGMTPIAMHPRAGSTTSLTSTRSAPAVSMGTPSPDCMMHSRITPTTLGINLDYFPLGEDIIGSCASSSTMQPPRKQNQMSPNIADSSWENLITGFDNSTHMMFPSMTSSGNVSMDTTGNDWMQDGWMFPNVDISTKAPVPQSLLSFSGESMTSGDDMLFSVSSNNGSTSTHDNVDLGETFKGITIPVDDEFDLQDVDA